MWFGFGIITLVLATIASFHVRIAARWKGTSTFHKEGSYELQEVSNKGRIVKVRIGVTAPEHFNFTVRAERPHDRMFKWLGIATEIQTRDPQFDRTLYVESDARGVAMLLKRRPELRKALIDVFSQANEHGLLAVRVRCLRRRLWVEFRPKDGNVVHAVVRGFVPLLHRLREAISSHELAARDLHDPFVWRAAAVLAVSTSSIVVGGLGLTRALIGRTDILEPSSLFFACAIPGALLALGALLGIVGWLGGSSRAHLVLIEFTLVGVAGFALSGFALGREMNIDLDSRPAKAYVLSNVTTEHKITRGRRGRKNHHYYLHTQQWQPSHRGAYRTIEITKTDYLALQNARQAVIHVRPGALGFEWVERIEPSWTGPE